MDAAKQSAFSYYDNGVAFMQAEEWLNATQMFRAAIQIDPSLAAAHAGLGAALGQQQLWTLALESLRVAISLAPNDIESICNAGVAYGELAQPSDAERCFREVLSSRPGDQETMVRLATELAEQHRFSEALDYFQAVAAEQPPSTFAAGAAASAGAVLLNLEQPDAARVAFAQARALDSTFFDDRPDFARLLAEVGGI
jgi:Tfp pilus assembly protein PilF